MNSWKTEIALIQQREAGMTFDDAIGWIHKQGYSKLESIALLARVYEFNLGEAKQLVHYHPVWADRRKSDEEFHEQLFEILSDEKSPQQILGSPPGQDTTNDS